MNDKALQALLMALAHLRAAELSLSEAAATDSELLEIVDTSTLLDFKAEVSDYIAGRIKADIL